MATWQRRAGWGLLAVVPLLSLIALLARLLPDPTLGTPHAHFSIVSATVGLLALVALLMAMTTLQVADIRAFFLSLAFLVIAGVFLAHALTTPFVLIPRANPWVGFSAYLGLLLGALGLAASTIAWPGGVERWVLARQGPLFVGVIALLAVYNVAALRLAGLADAVGISATGHSEHSATPAPASPDELAVLLGSQLFLRLMAATTIATLALTVWRYQGRYRLQRSPLLAGFLAAPIFLLQAQIVMMTTTIWHLSWWGYHVLILAAFCAAALGLAREYARSGSLAGIVEGLLLRDTILQLERGYTEVIVALVAAVEAKDPYTRGHTRRVADLAARMGQRLNLSPPDLRTVSQAAILHDIGKIGVPDAILNKTGPLTAAERALVEEHTVRGYEIIREIRSLRKELAGVRSHHERLDGSGYPDGLRGEDIPLVSRIIAVADVYDALTSQRPYRQAATPDQALAAIEAEAIAKLDARCVVALRHILEAQGICAPAEARPRAVQAMFGGAFDPDAEPRPVAALQLPAAAARTIR